MKRNILDISLNQDTNLLKLIGIFSMLIDHVGAILFPRYAFLRIIGRIAFPLFAYSTMIGYFKTSNLKKYIARLLIIGVISQPIYSLGFGFSILTPNIMFTLVFELILLYSLDKKKYYITPFCLLIPILLDFSYSYIYFFITIIFYYFRNNKLYLFSTFTLFYYLLVTIMAADNSPLLIFSVFALPFILIRTKSNIKINKYFFYFFYPVHILILYLIKMYIL